MGHKKRKPVNTAFHELSNIYKPSFAKATEGKGGGEEGIIEQIVGLLEIIERIKPG